MKPRHLFYTAVAGDALILMLLWPFAGFVAYWLVQLKWAILLGFVIFVWAYLFADAWFPTVLFFVCSVVFFVFSVRGLLSILNIG